SQWVQKEFSARFAADAEARTETIIPVLIESCPIPYLLKSSKWVDLRHGFEAGMSQLKTRLLGSAPSAQPTHFQMFELMYSLLLLDQFSNGIWGASLEKSGHFYGHKDDPGSISISTSTAF